MLVKLTCLNTIIAQKWLTVDTLAYGSQLSYVLAVCVIANARDGERPFEMNYFTRYDQIIVTKGYKEYHCIIYAGKGLFISACTHIQQRLFYAKLPTCMPYGYGPQIFIT